MSKSNKRVQVTCSDCRISWEKRADSLVYWNGRCRSCAQKEATNRPDQIARKSAQATAQIARQGGIPNAVKITRETTSKYRRKYRPLTPDERRKKSLTAARKDRHWNWQGGKSPQRMLIRNSVEYKLWRESVFKRDNYSCVSCGLRSAKGVKAVLHADHIKPFAYFPELRFDLSNGRTLCAECHKSTETYAHGAVRIYGRRVS